MDELLSKAVLWKKVKEGEDERYISLFPFDESDEEHTKFLMENVSHLDPKGAEQFEKNDERAKEFRDKGNGMFHMNKWREAMEFYNKSIRFATIGSENISLAYANRSTCFLRMEKFHECLNDIELAKKANYPEHLMPKLNQRRAACLKLEKLECVDCKAEKEERSKEVPTLSFDPDEQFPCMANVLEIKCNEEFGRHIVAKCDLEVGQVISVDEAFQFNAEKLGKTCCKTCLKHTKNFIPCPNCSHVMFCDVECMEANKNHKIACGAAYLCIPDFILIVESILTAINLFPSVDNLISFVETALATRDDIHTPISESTEQSQYGLFLKLWAMSDKVDKERLLETFTTYLVILHIPEVKKRFDTRAKRSFLVHLIWHHFLILDGNGFVYAGKFSDSDETVAIDFMFIFDSFFNHSCFPNTLFARHGSQFIGYIARPVKKGEQLFKMYVDEGYPNDKRRAIILEKCQFECECCKCVPCFKQEDRLQIQSDSTYEFIRDYKEHLIEKDMFRPEIKEACEDFLSEYGHLPWTEEIDLVLNKYKQCMNVEFSTI